MFYTLVQSQRRTKPLPKSAFVRLFGTRRYDFLYGFHPVYNALIAGKRDHLKTLLYKKVNSKKPLSDQDQSEHSRMETLEKIISLAKQKHVKLKEVEISVLRKLSNNGIHQGVILEASPLKLEYLHMLPRVASNGSWPVWIALDQVTDPVNFGSIIRTATFFKVNGIVCGSHYSSPPSAAASKVSVGALEWAPLFCTRNMDSFLSHSKTNGWRVIGACCNASSNGASSSNINVNLVQCRTLKLDSPTVIVLGSEGTGLQPSVCQTCDILFTLESSREENNFLLSDSTVPIPLDSLNVNVASGAILYHFLGKF